LTLPCYDVGTNEETNQHAMKPVAVLASTLAISPLT